MTDDLISRQQAIDELHMNLFYRMGTESNKQRLDAWINNLPPAQPETCEGCKHLGKWENEVEYGYPSPCTRCKRRVNDNYER